MVIRRKYAKRSRRRLKRRGRRIFKRRYRKRRSWGGKVYSYRRTLQFSRAFSLAVPGYGDAYRLDLVPGYTEFTNMYDQYRINKVAVRYRPRGNVQDIDANAGSLLYSAIDYTDTTPPDSAATLNQYSTVKRTNCRRVMTRVFRPKWQSVAYETGVSFGYNPRSGWISCADPGVPHYGLKLFWLSQGASETIGYDVEITYYLSFKNVI